MKDHFEKIFWFVVGLCSFGAGLSVYAVQIDPRHIDIVLTFWLSTCVASGVGYLIGSSVKKPVDSTTAINQADNVTLNAPMSPVDPEDEKKGVDMTQAQLTQTEINTVLILFLLILVAAMFYRTEIRGNKFFNLFRRFNLGEEAKEAFFDLCPYGAILTDGKGVIISWNAMASLITDFSEAEMVGKSITKIIPERFREMHETGMRRFLITGESTIIGRQLELQALKRNGKEVTVNMMINYKSVKGRPIFISIFSDITEKKAREIDAGWRIKVLEEGELLGLTGSWCWDMRSNEVIYSSGYDKIFDWGGAERTPENYMARVVEADREKVQKAIHDLSIKGTGYDIKYSVYSPTGKALLYRSKTRAERDKDGTLLRIFGKLKLLTPQDD